MSSSTPLPFDHITHRQGTHSLKWDRYKDRDILPLWVADMDFQVARPIIDALIQRAKHGIFGYTVAPKTYYRSIIEWFSKRHNWEINTDWIITAPGVVPAIQFAVNAFCSPGEKILVQGPVYYPFYRIIQAAGCEVVSNSLLFNNGYSMDLESLQRQLSDPLVKLVFLCSPHNPVGRVWSRDELIKFGEICNQNNVIVIADEIHCDLICPGEQFVPYASINEKFSQNTIVCTAPSKTFNLAGMHLSNIIIPNNKIRNKYTSYIEGIGMSGGLNPFSLIAAEVAYKEGEDWLDHVLDYIWMNYKYLTDFVISYCPQLKVADLQGTYLSWIDFRTLGLNADKLEALLYNEAKLLLNQGYIFGRIS